MTRPVPMLDLVSEHAELEADLRAAIERVLASGQFILGPEVEAFEAAIAEKLGVPHAIGCASGSDALLLSLLAAGIGRGDEVITSAFSFVATAEAIARAGATPVFADIDPETYDLGGDLDSIFAHVTERTRAIIPVHLFGQAMPMRALVERARARGLVVIEDAAQSILARDPSGAYAGTSGDFGVLSFFPTKNLGALGDGGMVLAREASSAERVRSLRVHGRAGDRFERLGMNSRLDALQAALLRAKLPHLPRLIERRRANAARYDASFGRAAPFVRAGAFHVFNQYTVRARERDRLRAALAEDGIAGAIYYPRPLHREPCFAYAGPPLPVAERIAEEVLSLPIHPAVSAEAIERIARIATPYLEEDCRIGSA